MGKIIKKKTFEDKLKKKKKKRQGKSVTLDVDKSTLGFACFFDKNKRQPKPVNKGEGKEN